MITVKDSLKMRDCLVEYFNELRRSVKVLFFKCKLK